MANVNPNLQHRIYPPNGPSVANALNPPVTENEGQKKYGDAVIVTFGGKDHSGLVANSKMVPIESIDPATGIKKIDKVEHITAIYLDSTKAEVNMTQTQIDTALQYAISIPRSAVGVPYGFKDAPKPADPEKDNAVKGANARITELENQLKGANARIDFLEKEKSAQQASAKPAPAPAPAPDEAAKAKDDKKK